MEREELQSDLRQLVPEDRKALRGVGLRIGRANIYAPLLLKPRPARLHALFAFFTAGPEVGAVPFLPPLGVTSFTLTTPVPPKALAATGFRAFGTRAVRLDIVDRIADALFEAAETAKGPCAFPPNIVSLLGASNDEAEALVEALGWEKTEVTRPVVVVPVISEPPSIEEEAVVEEGDTAQSTDATEPTEEVPAEEPAEALIAETSVETQAEPVPVENIAPQMETVTLWRRKRAKPERPAQARYRSPLRTPNESSATAEPRPNRPRPDRNTDSARPDVKRPPRPFNKDGGNRPPRRDNDNAGRFSAAPPPSTTKIDPNNPFAVLAALKVVTPPPPPPPPKAKAKEEGEEARKKRKRKRTRKPREPGAPITAEIAIAAEAGASE